MNEELKACPFCGKMPEIVGTPEVLIVHKCAANLDNIKLERFEVWQQRPLEDAQVARIKAKSEEINSLKRAYADLNFDDRTKFQEQSARIRALEAELLQMTANAEMERLNRLQVERKLAAMRDATCLWKEDLDGPWETACGGAWEFIDDGPKENNCIYCPHCGKRIVIERQEVENDDDDNFVESEVKP